MTNFRKVVTSPAIVLSVIATILLVRYTIFQQSTKLSSSSSSSSSSSYVISRRDSDEDRYHVDPQLLQVSEHPDIDIRAKFQRQRISKMCHENQFSLERSLPVNGDRLAYFRHLMFDDQRRVIFCFVPKIGCTNMKRLMLYMSNQLSLETLDWPWVDDWKYLEPALKRASLLNKTLTMKEKMYRFKTYYKFMVVRNPLERLVSGYINKIERPVSFDDKDQFPHQVKIEILQEYRHPELNLWLQDPNFNISVTFSEFIRFFIEKEPSAINEHFTPSIDICHPCLAQFDFYANFRNFSSDVAQLIEKFKTNPKFYRDESLHEGRDETINKLPQYYGELSHRDRVRLLGRMYDDLLFYYTLYPSERKSHIELLGINHPIL